MLNSWYNYSLYVPLIIPVIARNAFYYKDSRFYRKSYSMCGPRVCPHNLDGSESFPIFQIIKDI